MLILGSVPSFFYIGMHVELSQSMSQFIPLKNRSSENESLRRGHATIGRLVMAYSVFTYESLR